MDDAVSVLFLIFACVATSFDYFTQLHDGNWCLFLFDALSLWHFIFFRYISCLMI